MTTEKIFFISLGCDKNRIDSENMLGILNDAGFSFVYDEKDADIIIINTCAFIESAKQESIDTILEMANMKSSGKCKRLIVAGCLSERYKDEILKELPEVDDIVGVNDIENILSAIGKEKNNASTCNKKTERIITTEGYYEYIKIAEGCDKNCTYCIIPKIRGKYKSFEKHKIIDEAAHLANQGVKELILVAQETTLYGKDLCGKIILPELLTDLCNIPGIEWIRLLYAYPENISDELLSVIAHENKICKYIDMPIQHSSDKILKKMGRNITENKLKNIIKNVRDMVPDVAIRTSLISGFPGESDEDHEQLLDFIKEIEFDHLGVFNYSREENTAAFDFPNQISEDIKIKRRNEIMELQNNISRNKLKKNINKEFEVLICGKVADEDVYVGRTYMDAPDVDGEFYVKSSRELFSGDIINAVVTHTDDYDMRGVAAD